MIHSHIEPSVERGRNPSQSNSSPYSLLLFFYLLIVSCVIHYFIIDSTELLKWKVGSSLSIISIFFVFRLSTSRYFGLFSPAPIVVSAMFVVYVVGGYRWAVAGIETVIPPAFGAVYSILMFSIGYIASTQTSSQNVSKIRELSWSESKNLRLVCYGLAAISLLCVAFFISKGGIPALRPDGLTYRFLVRERVSSYVMTLIRAMQIPLYIYIAVTLCTFEKLKFRALIRISSLVLLVLMLNFIPGWRNPLMFICLNVAFIFALARPGKNNLLIVSIMGAVVFSIMVLGFLRLLNLSAVEEVSSISYFRTFTNGNVELFLMWASSNFSVYAYGFIVAQDIFPNTSPYYYGSVLLVTLKTILPGRDQTVGQALKEAADLDFAGGGLNLTILGEAYADFGAFGVILYPLLYGILIGYCTKKVINNRTSANIVICAFATSSITMGTLTGVLALSSFWILAIILSFTLYFQSYDLHKSNLKRSAHE